MATTDHTPTPGSLQEARPRLQRSVQNPQGTLNADFTRQIGAPTHPQGYRNGHQPRRLNSRVSSLEPLTPQDRAGGVSTESFAKYQPNERASVLSSMAIYLQGRKVRAVTEAIVSSESRQEPSQRVGP